MNRFAYNSGHIACLDLPGDGRTLVFLHGLGCASSVDYPRVAAALAGRRCLLVDLLGAGQSESPDGFGYSVADHARCVAALVESLGAVDLFGHSGGGAVAIETAAMTRGVQSLILSEPNLDPAGGIFSRAIAEKSEADYTRRFHKLMIAQARATGDPVWAETMAAAYAPAVHRFAVSLVKGSSPSWREQLYALEIPRTVIFGERTLPDPDYDCLPKHGIAVAVVPDAGHSMANENPEGLAEAIAVALG